MSMIEDTVRNLLDSMNESRNHDFKKGVPWLRTSTGTLDIVKDIIACSNTQDGGILVLGIDDETKQFSGAPDKWWESYDITRVLDTVNRYVAPRIEVSVTIKENFQYNGQTGAIVILQIPEFNIIPTIVIRAGDSSEGTTVFRNASLLIRTNRASSEEISNPDDLRNLITRATLKNGEEILRSFDAIMRGQNTPQPSSPFELYSREIEDAEGEI